MNFSALKSRLMKVQHHLLIAAVLLAVVAMANEGKKPIKNATQEEKYIDEPIWTLLKPAIIFTSMPIAG